MLADARLSGGVSIVLPYAFASSLYYISSQLPDQLYSQGSVKGEAGSVGWYFVGHFSVKQSPDLELNVISSQDSQKTLITYLLSRAIELVLERSMLFK